MIEAFSILGGLLLALTVLLARTLRERNSCVPADNRPVWTWPVIR